MKTTILLTMLMLAGCSGADFNVGATHGDTGDDDAEETSDDTGAVSADAEVGSDAPDALPTDTGKPDTGIALDTGIDTGFDTGSPDTSTPPIDSGTDVLVDGACPDLDGDGQTDIRCGGTDCHDGNKDVYVGQPAYFDVPYTTLTGGTSWDYNCNGKADERWLNILISCKVTSGSCSVGGNWLDTLPACGTNGKLLDSCSVSSGSCVVSTIGKKQACH